MKNSTHTAFKLNMSFVGFPLRMIVVALLGVGATTLVLGNQPNLFALLMVGLSVALIIVLLYLIYPIIGNLNQGYGLALAWYASLLVLGIVFLLLPWIEVPFEGTILGHAAHGADADHSVTRVYLWILGLFVTPIVLGMEQLVFAQSEVEILEKAHEVADLDFRIRPHFFFNSLNSVASLIVVDPVRAEEGLLDLADMFRIILTDKRKLVPFSAEHEMASKYMSLEKIRLGDRLEVDWQISDIDQSILLPILTLQPLIENAIYHGIEARLSGGKVSIKARESRNNLYITIINPRPEGDVAHRKGNRVARKNLENRFQHLYKGEASISHVETDNFYTVTIKVPRSMRMES